MSVREYVGARYVPLFADPIQWSSANAYEPLTIVLNDGNSYTSRQYVPAGIQIDNADYWALTGNYNAQIEQYRQEVLQLSNRVDVSIKIFETVEDMTDADLKLGEICKTLKFSTVNNSGGLYIITNDTANGMDIIDCGNFSATLIIEDELKISQLGAIDNQNCNDIIDRAFILSKNVIFDVDVIVSKYFEISSDTIIKGKNGSITQSQTNTPIFVLNNISNIVIGDMVFNGNGTDYNNANNTTLNCATAIYCYEQGSNNIKIDSCHFNNFGFSSIYCNNTNNISIRNSKFKLIENGIEENYNYNYALRLINGVKNCDIYNNEIYYGAIGISIANGLNLPVDNISIQNNYIHDVLGQHGIYFQDGTNIKIVGNLINAYNNGIKLQQDNNTIKFKNVIITDNICVSNNFGIDFPQAQASDFTYTENITVSNNQTTGIDIRYCQKITCCGNNIIGSKSSGLYCINSNNIIAAENIIEDSANSGIYISQCNNVTVANNRLFNNGAAKTTNNDYSIYIGVVKNFNVSNNFIDGNNTSSIGIFYINQASVNDNAMFIGNNSQNNVNYDFRFQVKENVNAFIGNFYTTYLNTHDQQ